MQGGPATHSVATVAARVKCAPDDVGHNDERGKHKERVAKLQRGVAGQARGMWRQGAGAAGGCGGCRGSVRQADKQRHCLLARAVP